MTREEIGNYLSLKLEVSRAFSHFQIDGMMAVRGKMPVQKHRPHWRNAETVRLR
jgi:hypothetical protein